MLIEYFNWGGGGGDASQNWDLFIIKNFMSSKQKYKRLCISTYISNVKPT